MNIRFGVLVLLCVGNVSCSADEKKAKLSEMEQRSSKKIEATKNIRVWTIAKTKEEERLKNEVKSIKPSLTAIIFLTRVKFAELPITKVIILKSRLRLT
jgi:hypothetical protein